MKQIIVLIICIGLIVFSNNLLADEVDLIEEISLIELIYEEYKAVYRDKFSNIEDDLDTEIKKLKKSISGDELDPEDDFDDILDDNDEIKSYKFYKTDIGKLNGYSAVAVIINFNHKTHGDVKIQISIVDDGSLFGKSTYFMTEGCKVENRTFNSYSCLGIAHKFDSETMSILSSIMKH
jgi:hypothetical protein